MSLPNNQVSLNLRLTSEGEGSAWFTALAIPHGLFSLYALKPRKWLSYLGYAITGCEGALTHTQDKSIPCDMDDLVNAGDIYYFHAINAIHFVDADVISTVTSDYFSQSRSTIPNELIEQYGVCPFSGAAGDHCDACHLIPCVKGDSYIQRVTEERSAGLTVIKDIDDIRNMLFLNPYLRTLLDKCRIAFLPTPNVVLKTDDIVWGADPEAYLVTLHWFEQIGSDIFAAAVRGKSAALLNEDTLLDEDKRPPEVIYSMIYGSAALNAWAPPSVLAPVKQYTRDKYYPGDTRNRESEERRKARRERKEKHARERCERRERLRNRNEDGSEELSQDEESDDFDIFDMMMAFRCATRRTPEGLRKAAEDERKKASVEKVQGWLTDH